MSIMTQLFYTKIIIQIGFAGLFFYSNEWKAPSVKNNVQASFNSMNIDRKSINVDTKKDTTFLLKKWTNNFYHSIYIDKSNQSEYYKRLTNFKFDSDENEVFKFSYEAIKAGLNKHNLLGLPKEWLPLYQYKNHYFLYAPSDWGNAGRKIITDTAFINWPMDGPYLEPITEVKKVKKSTTIIKFKNPANNQLQFKKIIIHMIDEQKKIAVWEFVDANNKSEYGLFIAKEYAFAFNLVVNYSPNMKQAEFEFDHINFNLLLKK